MVDRDLVLRKLADLERYLGEIATYHSIDIDAYRADWKTQRIIERTLHLIIETCLDVADHIVADRRLRVPETAADTFEVLAEAGLIATDLGARLMRMVGVRNILVHEYARIDPVLVLRVLSNDLQDIDAFRAAVLEMIDAV